MAEHKFKIEQLVYFQTGWPGQRSAWSLRPAMPFASDVCYGCVRAADL
jgi:hypothetical protein